MTPFTGISKPQRCFSNIGQAVLCTVFMACLMIWLPGAAQAQFGGRVATVAVEEASEDVLSIFSDIQGRVAAGPDIAITATTNAVTELGALQIGGEVKAGQVVAKQDAGDLRQRLALFETQLDEAQLRLAQTEQGIADDKILIALLEGQLALLSGKSSRAETLAARNAVSVDAVDTARSAEIRARETLAQRRAAFAAKTYQQQLGAAAITRIKLEIGAIKQDIADTKITAPADGQIIFMQPSRIGFNRTGDVLMRTRAIDDFEVEVDIPLEYIGFIVMSKSLEATDLPATASV